MAKVYVAGTWENRTLVKTIMSVVEGAGHVITTDWTTHEGDRDDEYAREDFEAVKACDVFVLMDPARASRGKFTELGMALAYGKKVVLYGGNDFGIFTHLHVHHVANGLGGLLELIGSG
jgi:hypothetical protein